MKTEKLYDKDAYITEFEAKVLSCQKCAKGFKIELDRTAFFPEEGGQCCDKGTLNNINVNYVEIFENTVFHYINEEFPEGTVVKGKIDFSLRYRNMQSHSAEHVISGIIYKEFGFENIGFHLGEDEVTADFNGELSFDDIKKTEVLANEVIYKNSEIKAYYPKKEELNNIPYRSKKEISGDIRIVEITDCDICACCAPHVKRCGEIGIIKIIDFMRHRGGTRITFLAAKDAYSDYGRKFSETLKISNLLCAKQNEVSGAVENLIADRDNIKLKLAEVSNKLSVAIASNVENTEENVVVCENDLSSDCMKKIANICKEKCNIFCITNGNDTEGYKYVISSNKIKLKGIIPDIANELNAKGGGSDEMLTGVFNTTESKIKEFFLLKKDL